MSVNRGPKIVRDGLVLCIDAAERKSYTGSGGKWFDLTPNKTDLTITIPTAYQGPSLNSSNFGSLKFNPALITDDIGGNTYGTLACGTSDYDGCSQYSYSSSPYTLDMDIYPYSYNDVGAKIYGPSYNLYISTNGCDDCSPWYFHIEPFSTADGFLFVVNQDDFVGTGWFDIPIANMDYDMYISIGNVYKSDGTLVTAYQVANQPTPSPLYYNNDFGYSGDSAKFAYGTGDFSWEVWTKPISYKGNNNYLLDHDAVGNGGIIQYYDGILRYYNPTTGGGSALYTVGGGSLSLNTWSHIVMSRISGITSIYVNGVFKVSAADTHNYPAQNFYLCRYGGSDAINWSGYISLCRIYKGKGLTAKEVLQNFNGMKGRYGIK
jgi:hypothetical protein